MRAIPGRFTHLFSPLGIPIHKMKTETKLKIASTILMISLVTLAFNLGVMVAENNLDLKDLLGESKETNSSCYGLSVEDTSYCLSEEFSSWFHYNLSQINKNLSTEELKASGGVCSHASEWYYQQARNLGLQAMKVTIFNNKGDYSHQVAIIYDGEKGGITEYCIADQKSIVGCNSLKVITKNDTIVEEQQYNFTKTERFIK